MVDFKNLETFVWVSRLKSFRMAASRLHTTQPAISYRIAQLETELGVQLLERDKRTIVLTPAGHDTLCYAQKLLELRSDLVSHIDSTKTEARTSLRLGVSESLVHTVLSRLVEQVSLEFPHLSLEIGVDTARELYAGLVDRELDLALGPDVSGRETLSAIPMCRYACGFFASPKLKLGGPRLTIEQIARHPIITLSRATLSYEIVRDLVSRHSARPVRLHAIASLTTAIAMADEGLGIAAIPAPVATAHVARGDLVPLTTDVEVPPLDYFAMWVPAVTDASIRAVAEIAAAIARAPTRVGA